MTIKIHFTDFWPSFQPEDNYFFNLLKKHFEIVITNKNPDFLFFSNFGCDHLNYRCTKIFYTGENVSPNFSECDYAFSFELDDHGGKNYRLPIYVLYEDVNKLTVNKDPEKLLSKKTGFCNFVYSNPDCKRRMEFFKKLSKYKKVDSGGRILNNIGHLVANKRDFISNYKFTIAFENGEHEGYTTEKIFEPMLAGSIPIYWGNPLVEKDFNTKSFINYYDFGNDDELIEKIIEVDKNDDLYLKILSEPFFNGNIVNEFVNEKNILKKFDEIFSSTTEKLYIKSPAYSDSAIIKNSYLFSRRMHHFSSYLKRNLRNFSLLKLKITLQKMMGK